MKFNPPALFKLDVEGFEYDVLTQILEEAMASGSGTTDLLPSQISVELLYATIFFVVVVNTVGVLQYAALFFCLCVFLVAQGCSSERFELYHVALL